MFNEVWGCSVEEATRVVDEFLDSETFQKDHIEIIPGAFEVLNKLKDKYDFVVVTSRQAKLEKLTRAWVRKHYPGIFKDIRLGNHFSSQGKKLSKAEMCNQIGASVLIDDSIQYTAECAQFMKHVNCLICFFFLGSRSRCAFVSIKQKVILFDWNGSYQWNKKEIEHKNIVRLKTWEEIDQFLSTHEL
ncbi:hypothetical protein RFI_06303 [Reticulomyxa filosa]|uniref:Uncharacterized protein n=1 Tax=Reticulomyxa filosa TaxID=46433 RepID=X6NYA9_RETFI|nr:hypothetical protein RFI_06303 [Reticulomyxa filosa]|eukprot:ETO30819.1 hypothetical protein RFI_06303 [Reticulomyxa filosa]